ncbi:MAG: hypothetical protein RSA62_02115 [Oscillospiraceae bacterium]
MKINPATPQPEIQRSTSLEASRSAKSSSVADTSKAPSTKPQQDKIELSTDKNKPWEKPAPEVTYSKPNFVGARTATDAAKSITAALQNDDIKGLSLKEKIGYLNQQSTNWMSSLGDNESSSFKEWKANNKDFLSTVSTTTPGTIGKPGKPGKPDFSTGFTMENVFKYINSK